MRSRMRWIVSWLCTISLVIGMPAMASGAGSNGSDPTWPNPGSIKLNKTAEPTGNFGEWKVTLTLEGKQLKTTTDIVLVIDKSGSMNTSTRLSKAKEAAKSFADSLLTSDSGIRLAAVAFSEGKASQVSGFTDASGRADFKKNIDKITASGGTNIQAGLKAADDLLKNSPADKKYIVLLSDGEPTYSYKGTAAENSVWPDNRYNFAITEFDFNSVKGTGSNYTLLDFFGYPNPYEIGSYQVGDNGLPTISHAKLLLKQGISIYSIGLEVGNNNNAEYVLGNSQDRGYYSATSEDLQRVFSEISSDIKFAARDAVVTDPMGEKFNLQPGALNGRDYEVSQGEVVWDEATETFRWEVGTISEGKPATLSYIVVIDPAANPVSDTLYPTNGKTTVDYTNVYGDPHVEKEFIVPEVKIGHVKILVKGYAVNLDGEPVNAAGEVVANPDLAEQLYSDYHTVNGESTFPVGGAPISVPSRQIDGYQLKVGDDPTIVTLQAVADNIVKFGYAKVIEKSVTVKYVDRESDRAIADPDVIDKAVVGQHIELEAKSIPGYTPEEPTTYSYLVENKDNNEYIFYYVQDEHPVEERSVTLHHLEEGTEAILKDAEIHSGKVGDTLNWTAENITVTDTVYVPVQLNHSYKVTDEVVQDYTIYYKKSEPEENLKLTIQYLDRASGEPVAVTDAVYGSEGKVITLLPKSPTVTDAVYVPELESVEYTFSAELEQSYIFYYNKKTPEPAEQTVTVKYLEQGTNHQLANPTTVKGKVGDTLTLTAVSVSGYTPTKSSDTYQIGDSESQEYIFYYTKNSTSGPSSGGSYTSYTPPSPPPPIVPPLPPLPPKLDTENHFDYIQGYPDGMVKPQNNISREEVAAIFYRLMEGESRANYYSTTNSYDDVKSTRWSNKHISTMTNAGIITGYPDGVFKPGQSITRAEFAAVAARFDKLDERESGLFTDISGHWAEKYILSAGNKGWIKGYTDGTFRPNQYITRAEAMSFINSVLNRKVKEDGIHKDAKKWPDNPATSWFYEDVIEATNNHDYSRNADGYEAWSQLKPHRIEP